MGVWVFQHLPVSPWLNALTVITVLWCHHFPWYTMKIMSLQQHWCFSCSLALSLSPPLLASLHSLRGCPRCQCQHLQCVYVCILCTPVQRVCAHHCIHVTAAHPYVWTPYFPTHEYMPGCSNCKWMRFCSTCSLHKPIATWTHSPNLLASIS